jgi:serine protease Do
LPGWVCALLLLSVCPEASAQIAPAEAPAAERARLYEALARDVDHLEREGRILKQVVNLVRPTVVHIEAGKGDGSPLHVGQSGRVEEAGSGVIVGLDNRRYVLTNLHVIRYSALDDIKIKLHDGREIRPTRVWEDKETDVAVMAIEAPQTVEARLGDSDRTEIGDFVLAIGSPFGLSHSVTYGIISAKGRHDLDLGEGDVRFQDFIQTDAAINPGNSGGPLVNLRGEVVGVNTAIASASGGNEGIGFAIPINMFRTVARQLIERGTVSRAYLGVRLDRNFNSTAAATLGLARARGTRITEILAESPAAAADLRAGDIVLRFDGIEITDDNHLVNVVSLTEVGRVVPVLVLRDGAELAFKVRVGSLNSKPASP